MTYVFGYGSLVDRGSLEASLGRRVATDDGPFPVRLLGYRRCWNVATPTDVRPEYRFTMSDGSPWEGFLGWLGLEQDAAGVALGAVYRIEPSDLDILDRRESGYERVDVSAHLDREAFTLGREPVFTYVPEPVAVQRARQEDSPVLVMGRYLRLVERGFRSLGDSFYDEHAPILAQIAPFEVAEITAAPRDPSVHNAAADPARG